MASDPFTELGADDRARLEAFLVDFDLNWTPGRMTEDIGRLPAGGPFRKAAILEMTKIDMERNARRGKPLAIEHYIERFPELADVAGALDAVRNTTDAGVATADYRPAAPGTGELPEQFGRYRIIQTLGRGGMGNVYLAHDTELDRRVALKVPHFLADDYSAAERFAREARAAANIDHPNVCRVYDVGRVGETPYLTMAYIDGPTLADELRAGPLRPQQAVEVAHDIALALAEAHRRGVVHRDLKPGNILLQQIGDPPKLRPVVTDFGLARRDCDELRLTTQGEVLGTPLYMSPEQVSGDSARIGPASDVYALGAVLYESLTGQPPFQGSREDVLRRAITEIPQAPSVIRSVIDPALESIVLRALSKRPSDRFASMAEFATALDGWLRRGPARKRALRTWLVGGGVVTVILAMLLPLSAKLGWLSRSDPVAPSNGSSPSSGPRLLVSGTLSDPSLRLISIGFSADGSKVILVGVDPPHFCFKQAEAITGREQAAEFQRVSSEWTAFSPDGNYVLTGGDESQLRRWPSGEVIQRFDTGPGTKVGAISRDGKRIVIGGRSAEGGGFVRVWDVSTRAVIGHPVAHKNEVRIVAISDDGEFVYSGSADRHLVWETKSAMLRVDGGENTIQCALFVPGTKWCVVGSANGEIALSDVSGPSLEMLYFPDKYRDKVTCLVAASDATLLLSGSADGSIRAWNPATGHLKWELKLKGTPSAIAVPPNNKRFAVAAGQSWELWEMPVEN